METFWVLERKVIDLVVTDTKLEDDNSELELDVDLAEVSLSRACLFR